jgi:spoIIIJ-associated protein
VDHESDGGCACGVSRGASGTEEKRLEKLTANAKYTIESIGPKLEPFLEQLLRNAEFELGFRLAQGESPHPEFENPELIVRFVGNDVDLLLANRAELLLALEQLTMEMLRMPPEDHSLLCFDANDYRVLRIEELRMSAITAAERVKRTNVPFRFSPMTSRERRIIHLALRNEASVRSESAGMGPTRSVVVYPADMPSIPEVQHAAPARPGWRPGGRMESRPGGGPRDRRPARGSRSDGRRPRR